MITPTTKKGPGRANPKVIREKTKGNREAKGQATKAREKGNKARVPGGADHRRRLHNNERQRELPLMVK